MPFMQRRPVIQRDSNTPSGTGLQHQYMADPAKQHLRSMAQYATDFFEAQVQGLEDMMRGKLGGIRYEPLPTFLPSIPVICPTTMIGGWCT